MSEFDQALDNVLAALKPRSKWVGLQQIFAPHAVLTEPMTDEGAPLLPKGAALTPATLALLATQHKRKAPVAGAVTALVISVSSVRQGLDQPARVGVNDDATSAALRMMLSRWGTDTLDPIFIKSDLDQVFSAVEESTADLIVISVDAESDLTKHEIAQALGISLLKAGLDLDIEVGAKAIEQKSVFLIKSDTYGTLIGSEVFLKPAVRSMLMQTELIPASYTVSTPIAGDLKYLRFIPGIVDTDEEGNETVRGLSANLGGLARAECLIKVHGNLPPYETVEVFPVTSVQK